MSKQSETEKINGDRLARIRKVIPESFTVWRNIDTWFVQDQDDEFAPSKIGSARGPKANVWFVRYYSDVWAAIKEVW